MNTKARCNYDLPLTFLLLPLPFSAKKMILSNWIFLCISFYLFEPKLNTMSNEHFHYYWTLNNYGRRTWEGEKGRGAAKKPEPSQYIWNEKRHRSNWRIKSILYVLTMAAAADILFNCCVCTSIIRSKRGTKIHLFPICPFGSCTQRYKRQIRRSVADATNGGSFRQPEKKMK